MNAQRTIFIIECKPANGTAFVAWQPFMSQDVAEQRLAKYKEEFPHAEWRLMFYVPAAEQPAHAG